jgi:hypothetical protein
MDGFRNAYVVIEVLTRIDHLREPCVDGRIILKWGFKKYTGHFPSPILIKRTRFGK